MALSRTRALLGLIAGVILLGVALIFGGCASKLPAATPTPTKTPRPITVRTPRPTAVEPVVVAIAASPTVAPASPTVAATETPVIAPTRTPGTPEPSPASTSTSEPTPEAVVAIATERPTVTPLPKAVATRTPVPRFAPVGNYFDPGLQVSVGSESDLALVIDRAKELKIKWLQFEVPWKDIEPQEGQRAWSRLDQTVDTLSEAGLKLLVTVDSAPSWARSLDSDQSVAGPPTDAKLYAGFVGDLIERYKGKVQAVEVWSAPNLWFNWGHEPLDPGRYVDLLCQSFSAVKRIDPNVVVVSGGLEPTSVNDGSIAVDDVVYLQRMYEAGAKDCFDALGAHPKGYNNPPDKKFGYTDPQEPSFKNGRNYFFRETLERYRQVMTGKQDGSKRIWVTDFGWASDPNPPPGLEFARDNTRQEQADFLVNALKMGKGLGWIGPMFISNLNVAVAQPSSEDRIFSLWQKGGATPAYQGLTTLNLDG